MYTFKFVLREKSVISHATISPWPVAAGLGACSRCSCVQHSYHSTHSAATPLAPPPSKAGPPTAPSRNSRTYHCDTLPCHLPRLARARTLSVAQVQAEHGLRAQHSLLFLWCELSPVVTACKVHTACLVNALAVLVRVAPSLIAPSRILAAAGVQLEYLRGGLGAAAPDKTLLSFIYFTGTTTV